MMNVIKNKKGFTLIELMIVVVLIGVLSGVVISVINTGGFRSKAKDSQRIADLEKIRSALELYYSDYRTYPPSPSWTLVSGDGTLSAEIEPDYLNKVPTDPNNGVGSSPLEGPTSNRYNYITVSGGGGYVLTAIMEIESSNEGNECHNTDNWQKNSGSSNFPSTYGTSSYCYGVENP